MAQRTAADMSGKEVLGKAAPDAVGNAFFALIQAVVVYVALIFSKWLAVGLFAIFVLLNLLSLVFTLFSSILGLAVAPIQLYKAISLGDDLGPVIKEGAYLGAANAIRLAEEAFTVAIGYGLYLAIFKAH